MIGRVQVVVNKRVLEKLIQEINGKPARYVHDGVDYGVYQEFGTYKMAAQPFMNPAADAVRPAFEAGIKKLSNLRQAEDFVQKVAEDLAGHARAIAPVDTGALKNSIRVSGRPDEQG